jgi:hypothetical protein
VQVPRQLIGATVELVISDRRAGAFNAQAPGARLVLQLEQLVHASVFWRSRRRCDSLNENPRTLVFGQQRQLLYRPLGMSSDAAQEA